jgi:hypothetical protein
MFKKIADKIQYPQWASKWPRFKQLDVYDRLLCGTFYDHLKYAFFDEKSQSGDPVLLEDRRPSAQFRLPGMVARWSARKLFAGRHRPKIRLPGMGAEIPKPTPKPAPGVKPPKPPAGNDKAKPGAEAKKKLAPLNKLLRRARFWQRMAEAVYFGSVGAVAVTFKVEGEGDDADLALNIWKAHWCKPSMDEFGRLAQLRVHYTTTCDQLHALGITADSDGAKLENVTTYWFIRDYTPDADLTYAPPKLHDWNPVDGFTGEHADRKTLKAIEDLSVEHKLGFVQGHWFVNMVGGEAPDGEATWKDAIPNSVDLDYSLSQVGRGIRYNAAPQLVVIGQLINAGDIERGPMSALQLQAGFKEAGGDGSTIGAGDAKLLEMTGSGVDKALMYIDKLRNFALEQIAAARKDPDKMKAPMSGRAMEYLDEDSNDLVMDLRSQYGEDGALPLLKKIALAAKCLPVGDIGAMTLQWPRIFQPTPDELFALAQAFQIAIDPASKTAPGTPGQPATPAGETGAAKPAIPPTDPVSAGPDEQFMSIAEARAYWLMQLDIGMLDLSIDDDAEDEDVDDSPTPPNEATSPAPTALPIDELPPEAGGGGDVPSQTADPPGMIVHPPSFVNA